MTDKVADSTALPLVVDVSQYIAYKFWDGKHPHVKGHRIRVAWIAEYTQDTHKKWTIPEIAADLSLTEREVAAAILYYEQHKQAIDALEQTEREEYRHFYAD